MLRNRATHLALLCFQNKIQDMKQDLGLAMCFPIQPSQKDKKGLFTFHAKKITKTFITAGHTTEQTTQLIS